MIFDGEVQLRRDSPDNQFDVVVAACGYESRCRYFMESTGIRGRRCYALAFPTRRELAFNVNREFFRRSGVECLEIPDNTVVNWAARVLEEAAALAGQRTIRVFVDISSQTRVRIASILEGIEEASEDRSIEVTFGYSLAKFARPSTIAAPILTIGPVSPRFAGWSVEPELPLALVAGLGYEQQRAMGAVEFLEPAEVWSLTPKSSIPEYTAALRRANRDLLADIGPKRQLTYIVEDPNGTYAMLNSVVLHLTAKRNITLLPSGPKILALLSMLTALKHRKVSVWRVSAGDTEEPADRQPSGARVLIRARFNQSAPETTLVGAGLADNPPG